MTASMESSASPWPDPAVIPSGPDAGPNQATASVRFRSRLRDRGLVAAESLRRQWRQTRPWAQVLILFVAVRVLDAVILTRVARFQVSSVMTDPHPGYLGFVSLWDGQWYQSIAENGYPSTIPRNDMGVVKQNPWAFYPLFPYLSRLVMSWLSVDWPVAVSIVAVSCAAAAAVLMRSLMEPLVGRNLALWTVVLFLVFPSSPVLQLAYTESLSILLLVGVLWTLQRERYVLLSGIVVLAGLSRPIAVPLAVVIGVHLLRRLWQHHRFRAISPALSGPKNIDDSEDVSPAPTGDTGSVSARPLTGGTLLGLLFATVAAGIAAVLWPVIAWMGTGERNAYLETMGAWRGHANRTALYPWWANSQYFLGDWVGPLTLVLVLGLLSWWVSSPRARIIAGDLRVWVLSYVGYLLLVLDPHTSLVRYLLPLFPLGTLLAAASESKAYRRTLVVVFLAGQTAWVMWLWRFSPPYDWPP